VQRGIELYTEAFRKRYLRSRPINTWFNRSLIGLRAIMFRLGARVNVKKIACQEGADLYG